MFGGSCFSTNGNMIGGVTGNDELMVRVGPEMYETVLQQEVNARPMDFTGRPLRGFVFVDPEGCDMVRVGPEMYETVLQQEVNARPMDFTGRPLRGFVFVDPEGCDTDAELRAWLGPQARAFSPSKEEVADQPDRCSGVSS